MPPGQQRETGDEHTGDEHTITKKFSVEKNSEH